MLKKPLILFFLYVTYYSAWAQQDLSVEEQFAQLEMEMDSLSIFWLIDSLLQLKNKPQSELILRSGFNSSLVYAGRDYGIKQQSYSSGMSYYHKSGIYGDLAGYFNSALEPTYNLSIVSVGYLGTIGQRLTFTSSFERWIHHTNDRNETIESTLNNALNSSVSFSKKYIYASIDYSFLFGGEIAQRITGSLASPIQFFKVFSVQPTISTLFGHQAITQYRFNESSKSKLALRLLDPDPLVLQRLYSSGRINEDEFKKLSRLKFLVNNNLLTPNQEERLAGILYDTYQTDAFGLMNINFSLPLMINLARFGFILSYTYSLPFTLPGEEIALDPVGYFSMNISYRISIK